MKHCVKEEGPLNLLVTMPREVQKQKARLQVTIGNENRERLLRFARLHEYADIIRA